MLFGRQRGASLLSMLLMFIGFAFALTVFLKLFPVYQDDIYVGQALKALAEKHPSDLADLTKPQIMNELSTFYTLNNVRSEAANPEHLQIERLREKTIIRINYEVRVPFIKNIDVVAWFKNELDTSKPQACCKPSEISKK